MPIEQREEDRSANDQQVRALGSATEEAANQARLIRRQEEKQNWNAYWKVRDIESKGTILPRIIYHLQRSIDAPVTWFRDNVAEPLQDKHRWPYYHRRLDRGPSIDECGVNDLACVHEANEQYRLDKAVDHHILMRLKYRVTECMNYYKPERSACAKFMEDYEENELNFFIKYGELGYATDVRDAYMKQKHRMIWERRNPEVMAERQRLVAEHKEQLAQGIYNNAFWKKGEPWDDKQKYEPPYGIYRDMSGFDSATDRPVSKDWEYYKHRKADPEFDKEQGFKSKPRYWPL